jgi:hypothetical protein
VSRLLSAERILQDTKRRAQREGWSERFGEIYEPTLRIITDEIIPGIPPQVRKEAEARLSPNQIPKLE